MKFTTDARLTHMVFSKLFMIDISNIGTPDYAGLAYFWNHDYRHYMRDASAYRRVLVHDAFLRHGLDLADASAQHEAIIKRYVKN